MPRLQITIFIFLLMMSTRVGAQDVIDSALDNLQRIPTKYLNGIDKKVKQYSNRITTKTEKTLTKLSRWETKIQGLLQKVNPEAADKLFGNNQLTFTLLLQKVKQGEDVALLYQAPYNKYRDDVTTSLKYLAQQKENLDSGIIKKIKTTSSKMQELAVEEDKSEALQQFIKERKKQLIDQSIQYIGKSKYLAKINKEAYYYAETLKNYKELFADSKKAEETVKTILNKIPAFQQFMQKNSLLASLFSVPENYASEAAIAGVQTRASVQNLIQGRIASGGPNAQQQISSSLQQAQSQLSQLKNKLLNPAFGNGGGSLPDFKPNMQKTKTFKQRLEYGSNFQFGKNNSMMPTAADIGLSIGYKLNDKSVAGIGASYKMGIGSIQHIRITNQGAGIRSFIDWKLKKQFFISGGMEMNYLAVLPAIDGGVQQMNDSNWQQAVLMGLSKKISIRTKLFKETKVQLLYDFLSRQHVPVSQPVLFRIGYNF